jgi:peptidoglycan/xylan/chitin deacetylase (PgdA/CDA1 family)
MSFKEKEAQITKAHKIITKVCKKEPIGFRGPGYYQDQEIINILQKLNYKYDSSVLPGFSEILMTTYAYMRGRNNRNKTFGRISYILSNRNPYSLKNIDRKQGLLELPISILPIFRLPIHTTFAYFFGAKYQNLIIRYLMTKPKYGLYLFHAIDFVNLGDQDLNHPIIPLRIEFEKRINLLEKILDTLVSANGAPLKTTGESINSIKL